MNKRWWNITTFKIKKLVKHELYKIIIIGCIVGSLVGALSWMRAKRKNNAEIYYTATLKIKTWPIKDKKIYKMDYVYALNDEEVCDHMKEYLGGYGNYDFYKKNVKIKTEKNVNNSFSIVYRAYSKLEARKVVYKLFMEIEQRMQKKGLIDRLEEIVCLEDKSDIKDDEKELKAHEMMELGALFGMIATTIVLILDFLLKDYITDSVDVYEYFNKPVLAVMPRAKERRKRYRNNSR